MIEMQTKRNNGASQQAQNNFSVSQSHLHDLNRRLIDLLGDGYGIELDKPRQKDGKIFYPTHCVFFSHNNDDHYDENPSAWVAVLLPNGRLISGCFACGRAQFVSHNGELQPAPTLLTLSHRDEKLLETLLDLGCKEFPLTAEEEKALEIELPEKEKRNRKPRVGFPVVYANGSLGFHFRVALEGKDKWLHMLGGKAGEAVFGLHNEEVKQKIQSQGFVIITESPFDAALLIAADFPAIGCCGKRNVKAIGCDQHRETLLSLLGENGTIFVWREPDAPETPQLVANALQRPVKVISPPVPEENQKALKDAKRLWVNYCGKDWEKFRAVINELLQNATEIAPQPEPVFEPKIVKVKQLLEEAVWRPLGEITMPQNDRWLVEGLIKEGNLVILSARPKTAKSIVALNLAACVAMGKPFLDRSVTQGRALFVAYERFDLTLQRARAMGLANCDDFMLWDKYAWKLPRVDCLDGWIGFIERNGVKLVAFDTLVHFLRPELEKVRNAINAYDHIYKVMETLQSAAEETGRTIMLIHHDRKGETAETDEARVLGTTALTASVDVVLQLKPMSDGVICLKASGNAIEDTALYFRVGQDFWIELVDKPATTKEERAAKAIEDYLRQHGEATRQDLIRLLVEKDLAKSSSAPVLLQRAIEDYLYYRLEKRLEGKQVVYRLIGESSRPSLPPAQPKTEPADSPEETRPVTPIENVTVVIRQPDQTDPTSNMCNTNNTNNNEYHVTGVTGQPNPDLQPNRRITTITSAIGVMGLSNDPQATETEPNQPQGNPTDYPQDNPDRPADDLQGCPPEPERPEGDPLATETPTDPLWLVFDSVLPELVVGSPPVNEPAKEPDPQPTDRPEPESDPTDQPANETQSAGDPQTTVSPQATETEPADSPAKAKDLLVSYTAEVVTEPVCPACETELEPESNGKAACLGCGRLYFVVAPTQTPQPAREPEGSQPETPAIIKRVEGSCVVVATEDWVEGDSVVVVTSDESPPESPTPSCAQAKSEGSPPEPEIEFIQINSIAKTETEEIPPTNPDDDDKPPETPNNNGHGGGIGGFAPPDEPVATLTEPICPFCGEILDPDQSGLAACLGCGRLFQIEIPPDSPDDDGDDDNPPESPDGDGNPPNPQGNGHGGSQTGFAPPKTLSIPPAFPSANRIYSNKFNSPAILNRMTKRLPDGSIKLVWDDKTETVTPADLAGWQHIEEIPEVDLQDIESVEIPPVVVLDLETKGKDPQHGHILAVGLALFVAGKEVETQIFHNEGDEAALLFQVFDYLRETCDSLGDFILTGYNMFDFDLRFLIERSRRLRMKRACPFDYERDENGNIKRLPIPDTHGKYKYTAIKTTLPIMLIDTQHLVIRWDEFERVLTDYSLKSVAEHFGVNIPNRPKPTPEQIVHAFYHNRPLFDAYLLADLRETYAVFDILIEPYLGIAAFTGLDLEDLARKNGRGWVWEQHYERHYTEIPEADKTRKYKGGLVVCRKGLWFNCAKFDIASLYPTIALAYRIHSRKDPLQIGLRYLKTYTMKRLELKQKARETGDRSAQTLQSGLKVLINSYYGYFGSEYNFNDIEAAERVTEIGRKILTCMIAAVEDMGLFVVEADTDGIIVACQDRDPQEVLQVISDAIPPVFKVELERQGAVVFVSEMKNYMVFEPNGDLIEVKGGNWRGRDKPAFQTEAIPEFMKRWITQGVEAALDYARKVWAEIQSGNGWRWVVRTRRVGRGDKTLMQAGFKVGEKATYAYKNYKRREIAKSPAEGYDCGYYAEQFSDLVKEVIAAIDPAQIEAWREMVEREARPLIFSVG